MKIGDAVRFIGFSGYWTGHKLDNPIGLVLRVYRLHRTELGLRVNVLWPSGKIGKALFEETLEVINELDT